MKYLRLFLCCSLPSFFLLSGCSDFDGYGSPYNGYNNSGPSYNNNGGYYNDNSYRERRQLDRERERLDDERENLRRERSRVRENDDAPSWRAPAQRAQEHCPSGFSPSENKCSAEERRRGCKDMRLPGGLGCVHR